MSAGKVEGEGMLKSKEIFKWNDDVLICMKQRDVGYEWNGEVVKTVKESVDVQELSRQEYPKRTLRLWCDIHQLAARTLILARWPFPGYRFIMRYDAIQFHARPIHPSSYYPERTVIDKLWEQQRVKGIMLPPHAKNKRRRRTGSRLFQL